MQTDVNFFKSEISCWQGEVILWKQGKLIGMMSPVSTKRGLVVTLPKVVLRLGVPFRCCTLVLDSLGQMLPMTAFRLEGK